MKLPLKILRKGSFIANILLMTEEKQQEASSSPIFTGLGNNLVVLFLRMLSVLPLPLLYCFSDVTYFLLKNIFPYRKKVVRDNLVNAFPEKTLTEIKLLENRFYRYFSDVFFESLKLSHFSDKSIDKRISLKGIELLNSYAEQGKGVIVLAFHHHNWEWGSTIQPFLKHRLLMVYNKMRANPAMDSFLLRSREKWGGLGVQMGQAAKLAFRYEKEKKPALLWLAADQSALPELGLWTTFLNREAVFFSGPEKIARKTNQPVFFQRVRKISRGKYQYEFSLLVEEPLKAATNGILLAYVQKMEEVVKEEPAYYLWSHRRWKHKRPEGIDLIS